MRRTPYGDQIPAALLLSRLPTSCLPFPARDLADISFAVIHERAKRRRTARRSKLVNNCAASHNGDGGRPALARIWLRVISRRATVYVNKSMLQPLANTLGCDLTLIRERARSTSATGRSIAKCSTRRPRN